MGSGLHVTVVYADDDHLGVEVGAASERFSCSTRIYAGLNQLGATADVLSGFPASSMDTREVELGTADPAFAGGYMRLIFAATDVLGHANVSVECLDDSNRYSSASAAFDFPVDPASVDRFVAELRVVQSNGSGTASLESSS